MEALAPRTHDLLRLAEAAGLNLNEDQRRNLDRLTTFNIQARYTDMKQAFYRKATREFTASQMAVVEEMRAWLLKKLSR